MIILCNGVIDAIIKLSPHPCVVKTKEHYTLPSNNLSQPVVHLNTPHTQRILIRGRLSLLVNLQVQSQTSFFFFPKKLYLSSQKTNQHISLSLPLLPPQSFKRVLSLSLSQTSSHEDFPYLAVPGFASRTVDSLRLLLWLRVTDNCTSLSA